MSEISNKKQTICPNCSNEISLEVFLKNHQQKIKENYKINFMDKLENEKKVKLLEKNDFLKKLNTNKNIKFEDLFYKKHVKILYQMLLERKKEFRISSNKQINYSKHQKFVKNHPYRFWFLVKIKDKYKASLYLKFDNTVSLNMVNFDSKLFKEIIIKIKNVIPPLPEIPSIRPGKFVINISNKNSIYEKALKEIGLKNIQKTFGI